MYITLPCCESQLLQQSTDCCCNEHDGACNEPVLFATLYKSKTKKKITRTAGYPLPYLHSQVSTHRKIIKSNTSFQRVRFASRGLVYIYIYSPGAAPSPSRLDSRITAAVHEVRREHKARCQLRNHKPSVCLPTLLSGERRVSNVQRDERRREQIDIIDVNVRGFFSATRERESIFTSRSHRVSPRQLSPVCRVLPNARGGQGRINGFPLLLHPHEL